MSSWSSCVVVVCCLLVVWGSCLALFVVCLFWCCLWFVVCVSFAVCLYSWFVVGWWLCVSCVVAIPCRHCSFLFCDSLLLFGFVVCGCCFGCGLVVVHCRMYVADCCLFLFIV